MATVVQMVVPNNTDCNSSPMHAKEFQMLSAENPEIDMEGVEEFVDVPTDVHPIEVSCGTSYCCCCLFRSICDEVSENNSRNEGSITAYCYS